MEAEPLLYLPMGPVRTLRDNRVGSIPNCEDAAPPRCAPVCKPTCCGFCAFCVFRYFNSARASGGVCSACYAFCACYLVCACCARCARSTRFQKPYLQHRWPQKRASCQKRTDGRQKKIMTSFFYQAVGHPTYRFEERLICFFVTDKFRVKVPNVSYFAIRVHTAASLVWQRLVGTCVCLVLFPDGTESLRMKCRSCF